MEVLPYGWQSQARYLSALGATITVRQAPDGSEARTDQGNLLLDSRFGPIADPHGLALSPDEQWLVCAASGTQELLVYRRPDLPFKDYGGTDHIDPALLKDKDRFDAKAVKDALKAQRFANAELLSGPS